MRFGVLGPLAVWTDHGEPVAVPGKKVRALLAVLLVHRGRAVSGDRLVDDVWGATPPADPPAALHVRVSQLRRALAGAEPGGRQLVVSAAPGYALRAEPDAVDAHRFAALVEQARLSTDLQTRVALLDEALALWRGAALADFADEEFARPSVARWHQQWLEALEVRAEARLELGEHAELAGELDEVLCRYPYRDRLRAVQMRALHRTGRTVEALDSYQRLRHRLADELGLDPDPELTALHGALLTGAPSENPPRRVPGPVATNLPAPVTELIGREHAVGRVRELMTGSRLITLTGPGGVGKTSVALAVGRELAKCYPDGVWLVDLTTWDGSGDPAELVLAALSIPDAVGDELPASERLAAVARDREMLLLLDNCEHVIEAAAAMLGALLPAADRLRVLATSREPLRLRGETRFAIPPLEVPDTDEVARLARCAAVRLFLARAGLEQPSAGVSTVDDSGQAAGATDVTACDRARVAEVADVCRRLDGIPLALELAATRVPALGVTELAARLRVPTDRFGLLEVGPRDAPARQRTLAAVIDWSWRLLTDPERAVLRRLAVHVGGATSRAAEAVCAGPDVGERAVLDLLADLVDRSLVVRVEGPRFRLLESVAAYCLAELRDSGELHVWRRRHAEHYLSVAEREAPRLRGTAQRATLHRLDAEVANLRAAARTFRRDGMAEPALRLAVALVWYWFLRGRLAEASRDLEAALALSEPVPCGLRACAEAWAVGLAIRQGQLRPEHAADVLARYEPVAEAAELGMVQWFHAASTADFGDVRATGELLARAMRTAETSGDAWVLAAALSCRAMLAHMRSDSAALEADARKSVAIFAELGDEWGGLQATDWLIGLAELAGEYDEAHRLCREGLRTAEEIGLVSDVAGRLSWLAWISVQTEDYDDAERHATRARRLCVERGDRAGEVFATISLAYAARRAGHLASAERHLQWLLTEARQQQTGRTAPPYLSMVLVELGCLAVLQGDPAAALDWQREAFAVCQVDGYARGMAAALEGMTAALLASGHTGVAARLLGAATAIRDTDGSPLSTSERAELDRTEAALRAAEPDFAVLFAGGAKLGPEQARSLLDDRA